MNKYIFLLILFFHTALSSAEFVLFTQPKTGTHLLIPILTELTGKQVYWAQEYNKNQGLVECSYEEGFKNFEYVYFNLTPTPWKRQTMDTVWRVTEENNAFLHLHAPYSLVMEEYLRERMCVNFFITRDPRDQIVSLLNHYKYIHFNDKEIESIDSDDKRLLQMIRKESRVQTVHYMGWIKSPLCCVLDFNKLMGSHGGVATDEDALEEMRKIALALEQNLSDRYLKRVLEKHFGHGWSFFKGKPGSWKELFNEEHKAAVKEEIGDLLIELGYEKDFNW